MAFVIRNPGIL